MSEIDMKTLLDENRFPSGWKLISLLLYTPIGLILLIIRLLLSLQLWLLASLLPDCETLRRFLNHGLSLVFGIIVKVNTSKDEGEGQNKESRIIIANSISALDHFALRRVSKIVSPSVWDVPAALSNALGLQSMDTSGRDALVASIERFLASSEYKVIIQAEFGATNNRVALLKFNSWPFSIERSVQPVAIKAWRPEFVDVRLTTLASTWWADVLYFMFVPYTVFTLTYLTVKRNTDPEALAREVESDIASALNLRTSSYTIFDKKEYEKRYLMEKMRNRNIIQSRGPINSANSPAAAGQTSMEMQRMARQVSEVLPLVPRNVILKDLLKTRNIDLTIANILDGIVTYTPEPAPPMVTPECSTSIKRQANSLNDNSNFGTLSFQKRKAMMIAEAREKYIQKHKLENC